MSVRGLIQAFAFGVGALLLSTASVHADDKDGTASAPAAERLEVQVDYQGFTLGDLDNTDIVFCAVKTGGTGCSEAEIGRKAEVVEFGPEEDKLAAALARSAPAEAQPSTRLVKLARIRFVYHMGTVAVSLPVAWAMATGPVGYERILAAMVAFGGYGLGYYIREARYERYQKWALSHFNDVKNFRQALSAMVNQIKTDGVVSYAFTLGYLAVMFHQLDWTILTNAAVMTGVSLFSALPINMFLARLRKNDLASPEEVGTVRLNLTFQSRIIDFARATEGWSVAGYAAGMVVPIASGALYLLDRRMSEEKRQEVAGKVRNVLTKASRYSGIGFLASKVGQIFEPGFIERVHRGEGCMSILTGKPLFRD